ncbi:hypothetical protein I550_0496 [Mycobacterium intracellulare 1956]|uniref:Uncharacterized protein n=1 Tax=Mycobacterium intracellulare 1956 TaxID=1299331 RepID=X8CNF7_MYCIT|nr:hypothetical protein I548_3483 [Mycobacterium intracellulare]EUA57371.1 hypothetical protein I550_0496 [Mycobacterium intracellulare 1956]
MFALNARAHRKDLKVFAWNTVASITETLWCVVALQPTRSRTTSAW